MPADGNNTPVPKPPAPTRVLSGIQPTGRFHWGNYFGAIRQYIDLQTAGEAYYFIADLHALTTVREPDRLRALVHDAAVDLVSLGLDPDHATLFVQSDVPEVTELTWLLMTVTPMGLLERCHAYLKPGGRLYLSTPNIACLHNRLRLLIGKYPHLMEYRNEIHHVRMYTVPVLLQHLSCHGFKPLICKGVNLLPITSHKIKVLDKLSASMASHLPSFCSQVFVVAEAIQ